MPPAIVSLLTGLYVLVIQLPSDDPGGQAEWNLPNGGVGMVAEAGRDASAGRQGRSVLPMARGRTFESLDEYLDYLKSRRTMDVGWYDEVAPGVYQLMTMTPPAEGEARLFTRAELRAKFGFSH